MKKHAFLLCFFLYNLILSQNQIIVGPQNDCALKNIKKNVHTSSEWFDVTGVTKLKIITLQHRTYDKSRIYNENGVLIWEWNGESYSDTWYRKEHYLDINTYKIKVEFTQGYNDPFCNGFVQVEKVVFNKLNNNIQNNNITSFTKESSQKRDEIYNLNGSKFEDFSNKYNIINSVNSSFSGKKSPYPSNPSESFYKKDYYNNKLIYEGYVKQVTTASYNNSVYKEEFKHGIGKEYFSNTNGYLEGYFINNKLNGYGEHFSDGFSYKGYFVNGERDGEGILVNDGLNGTSKYIYEGEFKNNKFHGKGIFLNEILAYVGEFSYGKFNGYGELKHSHNNGVIQKGFFENGNYIGEQLQITQNESNLSNNNNVENSNSTVKNENNKSIHSDVNCNFKFFMPKIAWKFIDNRRKCVYCRARYVPFSKVNVEEAKQINIVRSVQDKLNKHWETINASDEHKEKDRQSLIKFFKRNNYSSIVLLNAKMTEAINPILNSAKGYYNLIGDNSVNEYLDYRNIYLYSVEQSNYCSRKCQNEDN